MFPLGELRSPYKETAVTIEGNDRYHLKGTPVSFKGNGRFLVQETGKGCRIPSLPAKKARPNNGLHVLPAPFPDAAASVPCPEGNKKGNAEYSPVRTFFYRSLLSVTRVGLKPTTFRTGI